MAKFSGYNLLHRGCKKLCANAHSRLQPVPIGGMYCGHTKELLDTLMQDYEKPEDIIGEAGLLKQPTKQLLERAMQAEPPERFCMPITIF